MPENMLPALIGVLGTVCTSLITAIVGPLVVSFIQRQKAPPVSTEPGIALQAVPSEKPYASVFAFSALGLGIINLCAWFLPICGLPLSILGLTFGIASLSSPRRGIAIAGIVLCVVGLIAGVVNAAVGAYLGYTGQHPLLQ
jgi:hypothetical protein